MNKWPIFICYRRDDGREAASYVRGLLHKQKVKAVNPETNRQKTFELSVYQDTNVASPQDWMKTHELNLECARAFVMICTAGAKIDHREDGGDDWVHHEIDWWLENRPKIAPILIDATGADARYLPIAIETKWPRAQRTKLVAADWDKLKPADLKAAQDSTRAPLIGGIVGSGEEYLKREREEREIQAQKLQAANANAKRWKEHFLLAAAAGIYRLLRPYLR